MTKDDIVYLDKNKLPGLDIQTNLQKKGMFWNSKILY